MNDTKSLASEHELADTLISVTSSLMNELHPGKTHLHITLDSTLDKDLGLDSLSRIELIARIERHFGVTLPENVYVKAESPRDLVRELIKASSIRMPDRSALTKLHSIGKKLMVPDQADTLVDILEWHVQQHAARTHIQLHTDEGNGTSVSYQALMDGSAHLATGLQQLGIEPGDCVAIMLPTSEEYFFTFFGILLAGAIPVPIYPPLRPSQLEDHLRRHAAILANCNATCMITIDEAKKVARLLKSQVDTLYHISTVQELMDFGTHYEKPAIAPLDTAFLQYTSGSTGQPKGVVLTHRNLLANIRAMGERVKASSNDVFVSWLPLYHDMGLIGAWLGSLYYGALFVVMPPLSFLARPQRWLQAIHQYRGTLSAAPNFGYELCLHRLQDNDLSGLDLSTWRAAFNGAEAVIPETVTGFSERFARYGFRADAMMPVYGLAECSVGLAFPPLNQGVIIDRINRQSFMTSGHAIPVEDEDKNALRFVSCGQPLSGHEIRITDNQGNELPDRQEGHLQFRGPSATSGYLHNPVATRKLYAGDWLDTGDLAYMSQGNLYITGRTRDIIIRAGRNLYPHELEEAIGEIPEIRRGRVAVFGATSNQSGSERLIILAESRKKDSATQEKLRQRVNEVCIDVLGEPADDIVIALPGTVLKTSSGKVRRSACRELYEQGLIGKSRVPVWRQILNLLLASIMPQTRRIKRGFTRGLWTRYAQTIFWILSPLTWLAVVVTPLPSLRWIEMRYATRILSALTGCPIKVEGRENLLDFNQPCIYVANHASYLDGPFVITALKRPFSFVAKIELARQFIAGTFLRRINTEFVERFDAEKGLNDIQRIAQLADSNRSLFFFPEGTFTRIPGLSSFRMGAFLIAAETGLPVIPISIRGARSILRATSVRPGRGTIHIVIGKPILRKDLVDVGQSDTWATALAIRDMARAHILTYCGEPDLEQEP